MALNLSKMPGRRKRCELSVPDALGDVLTNLGEGCRVLIADDAEGGNRDSRQVAQLSPCERKARRVRIELLRGLQRLEFGDVASLVHPAPG